MNPPDDNLAAAMARHALELPAAQVALLERYCGLLWDWNTKLNLTRHTDWEKFVARDLTDSLAFARFLEPKERVLDVGTGGGVPGVVLAILRSDLQVSLCESVGKKAKVVAEIVAQLGLPTPVLHARAEAVLEKGDITDYLLPGSPKSVMPPFFFDTLVIRAVARLRKLLEWFRPHWKSFDRMLVLKGPSWVEERGEARHYGLFHDLELRKLAAYPLPGTNAESVLLQIRRKVPSPSGRGLG